VVKSNGCRNWHSKSGCECVAQLYSAQGVEAGLRWVGREGWDALNG
jgi:hypothetical protein